MMKKVTRAHIMNFLDEVFVLIFTWVGVLLSQVTLQKARGNDLKHLHFSLLQVITSGVIATMVYSKFYVSLELGKGPKPSYLKRITNAISQGVLFNTGNDLLS